MIDLNDTYNKCDFFWTKVNILYLVHLLRGVCIHQTSERIALQS